MRYMRTVNSMRTSRPLKNYSQGELRATNSEVHIDHYSRAYLHGHASPCLVVPRRSATFPRRKERMRTRLYPGFRRSRPVSQDMRGSPEPLSMMSRSPTCLRAGPPACDLRRNYAFLISKARVVRDCLASPKSIEVFVSTNRSFSTPEKPVPRPRFRTITLFESDTFKIGMP